MGRSGLAREPSSCLPELLKGAAMAIRVFAVVRLEDYGHLRRLIPDLPAEFSVWIEQRFIDRQRYEDSGRRLAKIERISPAEFAQFCIKEGRSPTVRLLDDWATVKSWLP